MLYFIITTLYQPTHSSFGSEGDACTPKGVVSLPSLALRSTSSSIVSMLSSSEGWDSFSASTEASSESLAFSTSRNTPNP